mmetsp:Transcript_163666/g.524841  ORF Transcript_163666/g.524841 Transcript_163666/m.524841 type:complete len:1938 (+) Transcript_163666:50-5863(+)
MGGADFVAEAPSLAAAVSRLFAIYGQSRHFGQLDVSGHDQDCTWRTYAETGVEAAHLAAGLAAHPLSLPRRYAVAVCLPNCPEWLIADFACALDDFIVFGLHAEWPDSTIRSVLSDAEVVCCIASSAVTGRIVAACADGSVPSLRSIVEVAAAGAHPVGGPSRQNAPLPAGLQLACYEQVLAVGAKLRKTHTGFGFGAVHADTDTDSGDDAAIFTLLYSSGTGGGPPKATAVPKAVWRKTNCTPGPFASMALAADRRAVSYMALAHGADRGVVWSVTFAGGSVGFLPSDDHPKFFEGMRFFKPTFFLGMSYFWQDRYNAHLQRLMPELDAVLARHLGSSVAMNVQQADPGLWRALRTALLQTRRGQSLERSCLEEARESMGGALLLTATGGAHTPKSVQTFMAGCLEVGNETRVMDVYGSTEFPGVATNGAIDPDVELKFLEVRAPDGQLLFSPEDEPPQGEIAVRRRRPAGGAASDALGAATLYWQRPELNEAAWTEDGFYRMGDIGLLDYANPVEGGQPRLCIIDRVKNLEEVYWQGDSAWIQATALEDGVYSVLPEVQSIVLASDRNRDGVVAIVVLPEACAAAWRKRQPEGFQLPSAGEMRSRQAQHPRGSQAAADAVPAVLESAVLSALRDAGMQEGLEPYEVPSACVIDLTPWSSEAGQDGTVPLLTMTGKPLRGAVKLTYLEAVGSRYGRADAGFAPPSRVASLEPSTAERAVPPSDELDKGSETRARALLAALAAEAGEETHSRSQHEFAAKFKSPLPAEKRGSRVCDTSFLDDGGTKHAEAETALSREWLCGQQAFEFVLVRDVDSKGQLVKCDAVAESPATLAGGGAVLEVTVNLPDLGIPKVSDRQLRFSVNAFETVRRLRRRVAAELGMPARALSLVSTSGGELDDDGQTLDELGASSISVTALIMQGEAVSAFHSLEKRARQSLNETMQELKSIALGIRACAEHWGAEARAQREVIEASLRHAVEAMDADVCAALLAFSETWGSAMAASAGPNLGRFLASKVPVVPKVSGAEPPLLAATRALVRALVRGKRAVLVRHEVHGALLDGPPARKEALGQLTRAIVKLRTAGDRHDVDTRALPVTWTMDLNWVIPPARPPTSTCIMGCGQSIYQSQMIDHLDAGCESGVGVADPADAEDDGVPMGGSQSIFCDISAVEIDPESSELKAPAGGELPARPADRYHSIDSGLNRRPELHEMLLFLHQALAEARRADIPGAIESASILESYDPHHQEVWVREKQHIYWLHRHVCAGKDLGLFDTPASLLLRACDAFAARPCLGVPGSGLVADLDLPRKTVRAVLPTAAGAELSSRDGFLWLRFEDLGRIIRRVASGFLALAPPRSLVAIVGYNDFEWAVADFATAVAGFASVGVHTTYDPSSAAAIFEQSRPALLCSMLDLLGPVGSRAPRWDVAGLLSSHAASLASVRAVVATDASIEDAQSALGTCLPPHLRLSSFLAMVLPDPSQGPASLPDPFHARGMEYKSSDGSCHDLTTLLCTSGSSGKPKAVAVGVTNFVHDIAGDSSERRSFSEAVTVSYIPLSHSSDRYKVWQHTIYGGRVGMCYFAAASWEAHEQDKKAAMIEYSSPIDGLFRQVRAIRPTNMACPPNIWAGLQQRWKKLCSGGMAESAALEEVAGLFGGRMKSLATGGSPTPRDVMVFAQALCRQAGAAFSDSYGTTESGAITCDGRQLGPKFEDVEMRLLDHPELGFTQGSLPHPCGEVAVKSPSLCLGYFENAEAEQEAFVVVDPPKRPCPDWIQPPLDPGRWYLTKDLASLDGTGKLTLIDRVGAVVRTDAGTVLRLGELETAFEGLPEVRLCLCHASGRRPGVAAVLLLREPCAAPGGGCSGAQLQAPAASAERFEALQSAAGATEAWALLAKRLVGVPLAVGLATDEWSVANGLLSGEMKKRRGELLRVYSGALEALHDTAYRAV